MNDPTTHATALIESSKAWLRSAELDPEERRWHAANKLLAEDYLRLKSASNKLAANETA